MIDHDILIHERLASITLDLNLPPVTLGPAHLTLAEIFPIASLQGLTDNAQDLAPVRLVIDLESDEDAASYLALIMALCLPLA